LIGLFPWCLINQFSQCFEADSLLWRLTDQFPKWLIRIISITADGSIFLNVLIRFVSLTYSSSLIRINFLIFD
jgi:hypothetical protein